MKSTKIIATTMVVLFTLTLQLRAQDNAKPREARVPLVVQVLFSEYEGEKKVSSLPYTLNVNSSKSSGAVKDREMVRLRMGLRVPILVGANRDDKGNASNYTYQEVGTNIDCEAYPVEGGSFNLSLRIERSSLYAPYRFRGSTYTMTPGTSSEAEKSSSLPPEVAPQPIFSHFNSDFDLDMHDGQTIQSTVATDPISGRTLKVDVTLHIVKKQ